MLSWSTHSVVDSELPAAAALADNTSNPTAPAVGAFGHVWDGSTWDRAPGTSADGALVNLGSNNDVQGDIAHDSADSGNPVKVGGKAATSWPTAVSASDRANLLTDQYGRNLQTTKPTGEQKSFYATYTTTQTGTAVWTPASGKKVVVTSVVIASYGATAGTVTLWFGESADTTYTAGTDQPLMVVRLAPGVSAAPAYMLSFPDPVVCLNADYILRVTTDANLSVHITVHGYEVS